MYFLIFVVSYLVIGNLFHRIIFPEKKPRISSYFTPGQEFYSKSEGFRQHVIKQENGFVHCQLVIEPFAGGPPAHIHNDFDEVFEIENGVLTALVNGEVKKLFPGQKLKVRKGTAHRPYNETGDTIRLKGSIAFPEKFAYHLPQVYRYMDSNPDFATSPKTMFQLAMFQQAGFDSYAADGPPVLFQKLIGFVMSPGLRLFGYKSYYVN